MSEMILKRAQLMKNKRCVLVLTEGFSDRTLLTPVLSDLFEMIDPDIDVFFPHLREDYITRGGKVEYRYDGDITSRYGVNSANIESLVLKLFVLPFMEAHPAYKAPRHIEEVIHIVDLDGAFIPKENVREMDAEDRRPQPFYSAEEGAIFTRDVTGIRYRNVMKRLNLKRLISDNRLFINFDQNSDEGRSRPYHVYYFASNMDHVMHGNANMPSYEKADLAAKVANEYFEDPVGMANMFINHPCAVKGMNYRESWEHVQEGLNSLGRETNINLLFKELLSRIDNADTDNRD